jgi:hypothetical protein
MGLLLQNLIQRENLKTANTDIHNPDTPDTDIKYPNPSNKEIEIYQLKMIRSNIEFGVSTLNHALQLIECMNESTLHYAIETITATLKLYDYSILNQDLCIQISQMGLKVLSVYSTDPLLLDVSKEMLITLINMKGSQGLGVVYNVFGLTLRGWIVSNSNNDSQTPDTQNTDIGDNCDDGEVYSSSGNAPPSLIEVGIDILGAICISAVVLIDDNTDSTTVNISHVKETVLSCLETLLSALNTHHFTCRRECIQTINTIFSKYRRKILNLFNPSVPSLQSPIQQFSQTISVIIVQALQVFTNIHICI